ncbi:thermonuclease family protein [Bacillaceae bacterium S4-13-58]
MTNEFQPIQEPELQIPLILPPKEADTIESQQPEQDTAVVTRIIDGDTIEVNLNGNTVDVRLLLIDTPESVHPDQPVERYGLKVSRFSEIYLIRKIVQLEYDGPRLDPYGRILAYLWVDGQNFNQILLEEGLANIAYVFNPPYKYYDHFLRAQEKAKEERKGMWEWV